MQVFRPYTSDEINTLYKDEFVCAICRDTDDEHIRPKIGHEYILEKKVFTQIFHKICLEEWQRHNIKCPSCETIVSPLHFVLPLIQDEFLARQYRVFKRIKDSGNLESLEGEIFSLLFSNIWINFTQPFHRYPHSKATILAFAVSYQAFKIYQYSKDPLKLIAWWIGVATPLVASRISTEWEDLPVILLSGVIIGYLFQKQIWTHIPHFNFPGQRHHNQPV